jgi:predicted anti-sigma-YlaC factor YlaD
VSRRDEELPRFCREARSQLPALVSGELTGWPLHVVRAHLRRCAECSAELQRQERLAGALTALRDSHVEPPAGLLDDLLAHANRRGVRERAAIPARGALSGARPELSVAFLTVGAIASTGIGYGLWRGVRALRKKD